MLDRDDISAFLSEELEDSELEIPKDIPREYLEEAFYRYVEVDYYDWLKSNFNTFFDADWSGPRKAIKRYVHG